MYIESLKLSDFKKIDFLNGYPRFAVDFFKYITLFDLDLHFAQKKDAEIAKAKAEARAKV